ncbi:uncharacterized protein METZ01_LOCUS20078 [marine metagenome]|jgi:hypothetical protein|uniref:3-keto-alpha-glucoside-1,2-lyase/3-keto-2-hydroxy-glucal hydratase domain-containing protein n=1 Tax=marine metagenome TaxID=408172 RepID=A0A381PKV5_9ZZZZ|tara:strand:- start:392 stop:1174 length:783 start_codon:yes stop_codon:yes gene_type:complete
MKPPFLQIAALLLPTIACGQNNTTEEWIQLFNGENLDNWQVKFTGQELGANYRETFRVENSLLTVSYENWNNFNGEFGHLFYDQVFSHYLLRVEYRFIGEQVSNGPGWAYRNNGLMLHSQNPASMSLDQEFPVSIEVQLLGGNGMDLRTTANICTPGTNMVMNGELITRHCTNSNSGTFHGDQWVTVEMEIHGSNNLIHRINGQEVFSLQEIQLDATDLDAQALLEKGAPVTLKEGYVALQAESHPTQFRKIELLPLKAD